VSEQTERLTIGEVARRSGVNASTVRYYESVGVLPEPQRASGGRRYTAGVLRQLAIIDVAQRAGFSLQEIRGLLASGDDEPASQRLRALADDKLPRVEALIERAQAAQRWLALASACRCDTLDVCALFDSGALGLRGDEGWPAGRGALTAIRGSSTAGSLK
jgi:MerR family redox-sensitive transcriptional activator SoxR